MATSNNIEGPLSEPLKPTIELAGSRELFFPATQVLSALAMVSSALHCKDKCLKAALAETAELATRNAVLLQHISDLEIKVKEEQTRSSGLQNLPVEIALLGQEAADTKLQLESVVRAKEAEYLTVSGALEQEREARLRLEYELSMCQQAAGELREQIQVFLKASEPPEDGTDPLISMDHVLTALGAMTSWPATDHGTSSDGPGMQADITAMQERLMLIARLHTPDATPLSTP